MSNQDLASSSQDLINYLLSVQTTNSDKITNLNSDIDQTNQNIAQLQRQLPVFQAQIGVLSTDNIMINVIISMLPPDFV